MRTAITVASILALGVVTPALAEEAVSYSYIEGGYVRSTLDDLDIDGNGFGVQGSYAFGKNAFGFAGYSNQDFDFDINADQWEFGAGLHFALSDKVDIVGTLSYVGVKLDAPGISSVDDSGVGVGAQLRSRLNDVLELRGGVSYVNLNDSGDGTSGNVGLRVYATQMLAFGADASFNSDGTTWMLGARLDFNHL
jgi:outer membrane protein with beta-barrel domain